jgi:hypothetical protein
MFGRSSYRTCGGSYSAMVDTAVDFCVFRPMRICSSSSKLYPHLDRTVSAQAHALTSPLPASSACRAKTNIGCPPACYLLFRWRGSVPAL